MCDSSLVHKVDDSSKLEENIAHNGICLSLAGIEEVNELDSFNEIHVDIAHLALCSITLCPSCIRNNAVCLWNAVNFQSFDDINFLLDPLQPLCFLGMVELEDLHGIELAIFLDLLHRCVSSSSEMFDDFKAINVSFTT